MTRPNGRQALIDERRSRVARLVLRKQTQREIVETLYGDGLRNPTTDQPYGLTTINRDIANLKKQWKKEASKDMAEAVADHLAELGEVRRSAWGSLEYNAILRALSQEADIRGIKSPTEIKHSGGVELGKTSYEEDIAVAKEIIALREAGAS